MIHLPCRPKLDHLSYFLPLLAHLANDPPSAHVHLAESDGVLAAEQLVKL